MSLDRFLKAQNAKRGAATHYETALKEVQGGRKSSCWIWYVFPQFQDPSRRSENNRLFQIHGPAEARAFLMHPTLGPRLFAITSAAIKQFDRGATPLQVFGWNVDAKKFHQSMTTFFLAAQSLTDERDNAVRSEIEPLFARALDAVASMPFDRDVERLDPVMLARWRADSKDEPLSAPQETSTAAE